jgi:hypothetical protein
VLFSSGDVKAKARGRPTGLSSDGALGDGVRVLSDAMLATAAASARSCTADVSVLVRSEG